MSRGEIDRLSFRVEFSIKCPRCDRPVPLDGPLESVVCGNCETDIPFEQEYWVERITDACRAMREVNVGQGTASMILGTYNGNLSLARFAPYCDECKTDFDPSWTDSVDSQYKCSSCGVEYPVLIPPVWLKKAIPQIDYLINALTVSESLQKPDTSKPVVVSCPSCAAALDVDGSTRFVDCGYCNSQVYLPDSVWMKFHTVKRKRRWFVVCKEKP